MKRTSQAGGLRWLVAFQCLFFLLIVVRVAWVCDDFFITARSIENLVHGYGPVYNIGERVQSYTHPLWMLLISALYSLLIRGSEMASQAGLYYLTLLLSLVLSSLAILLLASRIALTPWGATLAILGLTLSKAFVEYSTSGLENPLSHLLLVSFLALFLRAGEFDFRRNLLLSLVASLAAVTRSDTLLLYLPALGYAIRSSNKKRTAVAAMLLGSVPLLLWEAFSLVYYGFPFPNTAYAKLNTGISPVRLAAQGLQYLINSMGVDPITLALVATVLVMARSLQERVLLAPLAGAVLYLGYVVLIGGDFMSGRFLTLPLLACCAVLARQRFSNVTAFQALGALMLVLGLSPAASPLRSGPDYGMNEDLKVVYHGIADERAWFYPSTGLLPGQKLGSLWSGKAWRFDPGQEEPQVLVRGPIGTAGYTVGPNVHVVDSLALVDPLLARLPTADPYGWRIGHFERRLPEGYLETLESGENRLRHPQLAAFYDHLALIVRGPLLSGQRLAAILRMNLGAYDPLLEQYLISGAR